MLSNKYKCLKCYVISEIIIEFCEDCEEKINSYDENLDEEESEQYRKELKKFSLKEKKIHDRQRKFKLANKHMKVLYEKTGGILNHEGSLTTSEKQQLEILRKIIENALKKKLLPFFRKWIKDEDSVKSTRGPVHAGAPKQMYKYTPPTGYYGYALDIECGPWIAKDNNQYQWCIAYHGTSLQAVQKIIVEGFKPGPRQGYIQSKNLNPLSLSENDQLVGSGIFCTNSIVKAQQNNRSNRYVCILQCRINPYQVKLPTIQNGYCDYIVNDPKDIIPYRLLIRRK